MKHRPIARALCLPTLACKACKEQAELLSLHHHHHHPPRTTHRKRVTTIAVSPADLRFVAALALHFWQFWPGGCHILRAWKSEPVVVLTIRRKEQLRLQCKINCIKETIWEAHGKHWEALAALDFLSCPLFPTSCHKTPLQKLWGEVIWGHMTISMPMQSPIITQWPCAFFILLDSFSGLSFVRLGFGFNSWQLFAPKLRMKPKILPPTHDGQNVIEEPDAKPGNVWHNEVTLAKQVILSFHGSLHQVRPRKILPWNLFTHV